MKPKIVGLTGGIASGKSYIRSVFEELGVPCIDCDVIARKIHQDSSHPAMTELKREFSSAIGPDGRLVPSAMRALLGVDKTANARLKAILTPHVNAFLEEWTNSHTTNYVVWESALVDDIEHAVDIILVAEVSRFTQIQRILVRNPSWTLEQIQAILDLQPDQEGYWQKADDLIDSSQPMEQVASDVRDLHFKYMIWSAQ